MSDREIMNAKGFSSEIETENHLKENNITYFQHWKRCMVCSLVLFIHGWVPSFLPNYVTEKLNEKK